MWLGRYGCDVPWLGEPQTSRRTARGQSRCSVANGVAVRLILSKGSAPERDRAELCDLITVPLFDGPLLIADLKDHGITATMIESFNVVTEVASDARILVRRADVPAALAVVASRLVGPSE